MIEAIKFHFRIRSLLRRSQCADQKNREAISQAKSDGRSAEDIQSLEHDAIHDYREFDELIRESMTTFLTNRARKLILPLPSDDDAWSTGYLYQNRILTEKGIARLRSAIRQEKSERSHLWVTPVSLIIGLIGAVTALIGLLAGS
ncbi:MAG: hypothetical protein CMO55_17830 [Verrucomicrobiales bacterium]|nr:hypothetical protein [Verrucomicrobiales bacterium]